jgi:thiol-disulfide isomerase/thioredoxin
MAAARAGAGGEPHHPSAVTRRREIVATPLHPYTRAETPELGVTHAPAEERPMTQATESVVTPQRFSEGLTYEEYIAGIKQNQDRFQMNLEGTTVSEEDAARLRALAAKPNGPAKMLVLGEDWCPDVYRGMPVLKKLADAAGIEMRVFPRDEHLDIMNEFLKDGEFQSIPTAVFYTKDHDYILHWIERPTKANEEMPQLRKLYEGRTREEAAPDVLVFQQGPTWAGWRDATIKELIELLEAKTA